MTAKKFNASLQSSLSQGWLLAEWIAWPQSCLDHWKTTDGGVSDGAFKDKIDTSFFYFVWCAAMI